MTNPPAIPGFDGLMTLSRREGVDGTFAIAQSKLRPLLDLP